jgi:hypothetical protein
MKNNHDINSKCKKLNHLRYKSSKTVPEKGVLNAYRFYYKVYLRNNISKTAILLLNNITVWSSDARNYITRA